MDEGATEINSLKQRCRKAWSSPACEGREERYEHRRRVRGDLGMEAWDRIAFVDSGFENRWNTAVDVDFGWAVFRCTYVVVCTCLKRIPRDYCW